jgi:hypothetical protein
LNLNLIEKKLKNMKTKIKLPASMTALVRIAPVLAALFVTGAAYADNVLVNAVVDVTAEGKGAPRATPAAPVYYFPVTVGYEEEGSWAPEALPPTIEVQRMIARALASQGYLVLNSKQASLLLTFRWGRMAPFSDDRSVGDPEDDMATLVGGLEKGSDINGLGTALSAFQFAASRPRYFVMIEAFDFTAAEQKNKIPLWCARISTQADGTTLEKALPSLLATVVPLLGKDVRPRLISASF